MTMQFHLCFMPDNETFISRVEEILKTHQGRQDAILTKPLAEQIAGTSLNTFEIQRVGRMIREAIEVINRDRHGLICSDTTHGYWWANNITDDLDAVEAHIYRAKHQLANASVLKANIQRTLGGQKSFE